MKLSDIKGEKSLEIVADTMELLELLGEDERFDAMLKDMQGAGDKVAVVLCKHVPKFLRDGRYADRIISILASASDMTEDEYRDEGPVIQDLVELLTSNAEDIAFLSKPPTREE